MRTWSLGLLALAAAALGCDEEPAESSAPVDATYTVRGRLADVTGDEVSIQHEALPDFRSRDGEVVGMDTMTMPFHRPADLDLGGIEVNDLVVFTFDVRWEGAHVMTLREVEELPAGTNLEL